MTIHEKPGAGYGVIVIGGGAAGCIAAGYAEREGTTVLVLERNPRLARKILVTGKGRCNLTNNCAPEEFLRHVRSNPKFLYSALNRFPPSATMELFEKMGVPLKTERGRRVFPVSDRAMDIADALQKFTIRPGITKIEARARELIFEHGALTGVLTEAGESFFAPKIIIATGGLSYPGTGSTGDGYELARSAGHNIIKTRPSLVGIATEESFSAMSGLSLINVSLRLFERGKKKPIYDELGELLLTHEGISGPLVLSASSYMSGEPADYLIELDLKPGLTAEELDARLLRELAENQNRGMTNLLGELLPRSFIGMLMGKSRLPLGLKANQLTKEQRLEVGRVLKAFPISPKALGRIDDAVITAGGVDVKEVDPKTMESKLMPGLFFAGELLDVDAETGGYNLQIAFATGFSAGSAAK